jgi:predicted DNA-binding antitoxin AbrB/MazE fold protein
MTIAAKYEDGVFKPLEDVKLTEGTRVEVHVREAAERTPFPKSLRELAAFGMWADRDDIPDGVTYVNRLREPRF